MFESIKNMFGDPYAPERERRKSLKDRMKELEEKVEKLEEASFVAVEVGKPGSFFDITKYIGVSKILRELAENLGYELVYRGEILKATCMRKKKK